MNDSLKKIVLIGPVYPYKGGISHYTSLMYKALHKKYDVTMVSYKFQYPRFLFKKEQKDKSSNSFKIEDTKYWIHTANPFNWICSALKIKNENPGLIVIQWWHPYFAPCYFIMTKLLRKYKILFVCHNVFPHERFLFDRLLARGVLRQGSCFIVQSSTDANDLKNIIPNAVYKQTVHPTYEVFNFRNLSKKSARKILEIPSEQKVILFFGFVRDYKGLKYLIRALPNVIQIFPEIKLLIAGDFSSDKKIYLDLIIEEKVGKNITIYDRYIADNEVGNFFAASDLVVMPYESATQSGIVQIAYGFEKPVIVTNVGGLPDVVIEGKTGYVVEAKNKEELSQAIIKFYMEEKENEFIEGVKAEAYKFSWNRIVEDIEALNCQKQK